ncbi:DnaJ-domain-containing protein [Zymoseptoria brevis]|uniref:DnaJ-domain-containing protein n=1 Tax=Zymoseptoria brevis TaxID=1047168 RepID=A0A0F4GIE2_9PEZI|nr:DnaJ-domain-containing protein [Zymoseptoria brevis]
MPKRPRSPDDDGEDVSAGEAPTTINPYEILSIDTTATDDEIKKAYRRAALKHHPDKAAPEDKDTAHTSFQEIAFAFAILSDARRRKRYDTTGSTEESLDLEDDDFNWADFFREQYSNLVTTERINDFATQYKGSEEERKDVLKAYENCKGNMSKLYNEVMLSDVLEDEDRFRLIIDNAIEDGEVEAHAKYTEESEKSRKGRIAHAQKGRDKERGEVAEVEKAIKEKQTKRAGGKKTKGEDEGGMGDLAAMIQQRQTGRAGNFFDHLEEKYAGKDGKGKKGAKMEEPPEEAFARNAKKTETVEGASKRKRARK